MANDILGLELAGEITLARFATSVVRLRDLIASLSQEVARDARIDWVIESLEASSALQRYRGVARNPKKQDRVEHVVHAYATLGQSLEVGQIPQTSNRVIEKADRLIKVIDKSVEFLRFETRELDAIIRAPGLDAEIPLPTVERAAPVAYGAVEGRIQTMSSRGTLRFTLYDLIYDRGVSCYVQEGQEAIMRDIWGRLAVVEGTVRRDPVTGRSVSVRNIRKIHLLPEPEENAYLEARGVAPSRSGLSAEEAIRRLRDAD